MTRARVELIQSDAGLRSAASELSGARCLYLDTEFESVRSGTTLCLLQLSRGDTTYLIDTLRVESLHPLSEVLADAQAEWVLHAGQQDVALLMSRLGLREPPRLFDTQVAWALLGPEYSVSLSYLQYRVLGIRSGKAHQADDWKRRPLPASQLAYAAADIEHLPALRRILGERATALGRAEVVCDASLETVRPEPEPSLPLALESFRNAWQLEPPSQAALHGLIQWYNALAPADQKRAPESKTLLAIAARLPRTVDELSRIKGVSRGFLQEHGAHVVREIVRAADQARAADHVVIEPPPYATFQEIRLEAWLTLARAEICAELSVAPELALPARVLRPLKLLLLLNPDLEAAAVHLCGWRKTLLKDAFLEFARRHPLPAS
ncbi:MAG TPA: ribonuclease D [Polyangiaceae bacterium]